MNCCVTRNFTIKFLVIEDIRIIFFFNINALYLIYVITWFSTHKSLKTQLNVIMSSVSAALLLKISDLYFLSPYSTNLFRLIYLL